MRNAIFILGIMLISCETTVDPQLPDNGPGLVIYSFFRPGSPLRIDVFNTTPILQPETIQRNKDLKIKLKENGELVEEIIANAQGVYVSNLVPSMHNKYSFETTRGEQIFSASSHIPEPVSISHAKMSNEIKIIASINIALRMRLKFKLITDIRNHREDCELPEFLIQLRLIIQFNIDWIESAIGIVYSEDPLPFSPAFCFFETDAQI